MVIDHKNYHKVITWVNDSYRFRAYVRLEVQKDRFLIWDTSRIIQMADYVYRLDKELASDYIFEVVDVGDIMAKRMALWCYENLEQYDIIAAPAIKNRHNGNDIIPVFIMKSLDDAMAFKLRWC